MDNCIGVEQVAVASRAQPDTCKLDVGRTNSTHPDWNQREVPKDKHFYSKDKKLYPTEEFEMYRKNAAALTHPHFTKIPQDKYLANRNRTRPSYCPPDCCCRFAPGSSKPQQQPLPALELPPTLLAPPTRVPVSAIVNSSIAHVRATRRYRLLASWNAATTDFVHLPAHDSGVPLSPEDVFASSSAAIGSRAFQKEPGDEAAISLA
ncbi:hypothetical protein C8R43DRAFT_1175201 [Mycena crocata]|nr:hypothetical protein C8R43DRAFT_1175201 [Mycena crocata]